MRRFREPAQTDEGFMPAKIEQLRVFARSMRSDMTEPEARLWGALRNRRLMKLKFRRQVPLEGFIADFVCMEARLIVEVDGSQHADSVHDRRRDAILSAADFKVLRFWNDDVMRDLDAVCDHIVIVAVARME